MSSSVNRSSGEPEGVACSGECRDCGRTHRLPVGRAREHALELMREFEAIRRLDYRAPEAESDPALSFDHLFPGGHGNMFGVLDCEDAQGRSVVLRAFSSLRRGIREIDGWVPPLLPAEIYYGRILPTQEKIEAWTRELARLEPASDAHRALREQRKQASRALHTELQQRYRLHNFRGETRSLRDACWPLRPLPGGVGECCAPKLLDHAAQRGLRPLGLAEFYWGDSGGMRQGSFHASCETRCQPILGFMLCGLDA